MAHSTSQGPSLLHGFKRLGRFDTELSSKLPEAYKKFWREWKLTKPAAVHYIPKNGMWERDELTGEIKPIQDNPLPLIDPPESHEGIWGGEAVIKGFQKRHRNARRIPHFWVPHLKRSVVHSQVLNEYMSMVVTERTLEKIHECYGFDHYLLKHPACDLRSKLALKLKRNILIELQKGCPKLVANPEEQERVLNEFKQYLDNYTTEEIDWYGLTFDEALEKLREQIRAENPIVPHKIEFRMRLIEQLKEARIKAIEASNQGKEVDIEGVTLQESSSSSTASNWLSKINPFGKKQET